MHELKAMGTCDNTKMKLTKLMKFVFPIACKGENNQIIRGANRNTRILSMDKKRSNRLFKFYSCWTVLITKNSLQFCSQMR